MPREQRRWVPTAGMVVLGAVLGVACSDASPSSAEPPETLSVPPLVVTTTVAVPKSDDIAFVTGLLAALYGVLAHGDFANATVGHDPALTDACGGPEGLRAVQRAAHDQGLEYRLDAVEGAETTATGMRVRVRSSIVAVSDGTVLRGGMSGLVELRPQFGAAYGWVVTNELVPLGLAETCGAEPPVPTDRPPDEGGEPTETAETTETSEATETTEETEPTEVTETSEPTETTEATPPTEVTTPTEPPTVPTEAPAAAAD